MSDIEYRVAKLERDMRWVMSVVRPQLAAAAVSPTSRSKPDAEPTRHDFAHDRIDKLLMLHDERLELHCRRFDGMGELVVSHEESFQEIQGQLQTLECRFASVEATLALVFEAVRGTPPVTLVH